MSNILIFGYGKEGQSTEKFFTKLDTQNKITIYDEKTHPAEPDWDSFDTIFLSPGIAPSKIPVEHQNKTTNQLNWFCSNLTKPELEKVIGITGSKGKTTTTIVVEAWLKKCGFCTICAGNIGHPILDIYQDLKNEKLDFVVLELSSFQLELLTANSPGIAIFLGLFPDHLDRHQTLEEYGRMKSHLWAHQTADQHLITTPLGISLVEKYPPKSKVHLGRTLPKEYFPENHVFRADHFRENLGTVEKLSEILGQKFEIKSFKEVIDHLEMPEHRLEFIAEKDGIKFYNDAIAVNPEAVIAAVKFFGADLGTLILGGTDSGGSFTELLTVINTQAPHVQIVVTDSPITAKITAAQKDYPHLEVTVVQDLNEAVQKAWERKGKEAVCVLSPGGKSFDQFPNYTVKGQVFKELVKNL